MAKKDKHQQRPPPTPKDITLPRRQPAHGYTEPDLPRHYIPEPF